jgi:hypothetical protein
MSKVRDNLITEGLSGKLGKRLVFRKSRGGKTILAVSPVPSETREYSASELEQQEAFRQATVYAKVAKDQPIYVERAKGTESTSYNLAVADWFRVPQVLDIDISNWTGQVGETIHVKAKDDTKVTSVHLIFRNSDIIVEEGDAVQSDTDGLLWIYTTQTVAPNVSPLFLAATARDMPGNIGAQTKQLR